jgi:predicted Zn-dependent peptidase
MLTAGLAMIALAPSSSTSAVPFTDLRLKNGLRVVIAEDHVAPVVAIAVIYNVGSRDERQSRTGFAHLFEHLMFKGSENVGPGEHFTLIFQNGGTMNGTTDKDRTLYHETLPAHQLDLGLFLEADRMRSLAITQESLDNQRSAVKEERRVRFDNQPYGRIEETLDRLAYDSFAYAHPVIGSMPDLDAATVQDVTSFFRTYYAPNNAVMGIVGDVDAAECAAKVRRYFESIPAQPAPPPVEVIEPRQDAERRQALADPLASLARVDVAFKTTPAMTADSEALRVLATILGGGRSSRLYTRLVRQGALATTATASVVDRRGPGLFRITATVAPGRSAADVAAAIYEEIDRFAMEPAEAWELEKARAAARMAIVSSLQSASARAILLAQYALFYGDPRLVEGRAARIDAVTASDVDRVARTYLTRTNRSVVIAAKAPVGTAGGL